MSQAAVEFTRLNIHAIQVDRIAPDDAQGCEGDGMMFQAFFGEIGCAIGDNGDNVRHSAVILLRMEACGKMLQRTRIPPEYRNPIKALCSKFIHLPLSK
jgi:hypothetical protein